MIVVIGGGVAGLSAALAAAEAAEDAASSRTTTVSRDSENVSVLLLMKTPFSGSNTYRAQGGVACGMFPGDTANSHTQDTLAAGYGLCLREAVEVLTREGIDRVQELLQQGWRVDRGADGQVHPGLEAAHSHPRIIHAGGDETGRILEEDMARLVCSNPHIQVKDGACLQDLIVQDGHLTGIRVLVQTSEQGAELTTIPTTRVILATGGAGQLYPFTTNPAGSTGDGIAAALRAGAEVKDLEFYQFHPTALADSEHFLISEAVRGEGAQLFDDHGHRYMKDVDQRAELAPRDVVARTNFAVMMRNNGKPVWLDARPIGQKHPDLAEFLPQRFPSIDTHLKKQGFDWVKEPIPVTPAAHYFMGGIATDVEGRTSIPGVYAAGECACTGVHGANRLASNSLLEGLVFGYRAGRAAWDDESLEAPTPAQGSSRQAQTSTLPYPAVTEVSGTTATRATAAAVPTDELRQSLQEMMWNKVGVTRNGDTLTAAVQELVTLIAQQDAVALSHTATAKSYAEGTQYIEDRNLLWLAYGVAFAASQRKESRGAHHRDDYPDASDAYAFSQSYVLEPANHDTSAPRHLQHPSTPPITALRHHGTLNTSAPRHSGTTERLGTPGRTPQ